MKALGLRCPDSGVVQLAVARCGFDVRTTAIHDIIAYHYMVELPLCLRDAYSLHIL